jgi:hypothetical protein
MGANDFDGSDGGPLPDRTARLIADIEDRVRPTIVPTHRFVDGEHIETIEGRISIVDFETLIRLLKAARQGSGDHDEGTESEAVR